MGYDTTKVGSLFLARSVRAERHTLREVYSVGRNGNRVGWCCVGIDTKLGGWPKPGVVAPRERKARRSGPIRVSDIPAVVFSIDRA